MISGGGILFSKLKFDRINNIYKNLINLYKYINI